MKQTNGTFYHDDTPDDVIRVLENAHQSRVRLHISYGDRTTGRDWLETSEAHGWIGRSTGPLKVPLVLANRRIKGGAAILDHCIVRIRTAAGGRVLWQHPTYHHGKVEIRSKPEPVNGPGRRTLRVEVVRDGQPQAAFEDVAGARRYIHTLGVRAEIVA